MLHLLYRIKRGITLMRGTIVTFEQVNPYANSQILIDGIKKYQCLQVSVWAWVVKDNVSPSEVFETLRPLATPDFRLFVAEFINQKTLNTIAGDWAFMS